MKNTLYFANDRLRGDLSEQAKDLLALLKNKVWLHCRGKRRLTTQGVVVTYLCPELGSCWSPKGWCIQTWRRPLQSPAATWQTSWPTPMHWRALRSGKSKKKDKVSYYHPSILLAQGFVTIDKLKILKSFTVGSKWETGKCPLERFPRPCNYWPYAN